jgi:hypothetical protein
MSIRPVRSIFHMRLPIAVLAASLAAPLPLAYAANLGNALSPPPSVDAIEGAAARLTGQQARYTLHLDHAGGNSDIVAARGTMSYRVSDACTGWASEQRLDMTLTNRDGTDVKMVSDYATWESKNGLAMNFHMRQLTDNAVTEDISGDSTLQKLGGTGEIHYESPEPKTIPLPTGTLFPTTHTAMIIAAAEAGRRFVAVPLFDGTGPDGAQDSFVLIENWDKPKPTRFPALSPLPNGYVHVSFFSRSPATMLPDYEVGMRYWTNGVADDLRMDFGDFVMDGKLDTLTVPPGPHC